MKWKRQNGYIALSAVIKQGYRYGQTQNLKSFPSTCPKCRQENLIDAKDLQVTVIKGIEAKTQS